MSTGRAWSLHSELYTIEHATRAAALLLDTIENNSGEDAYARDVARSTEAVLTLVALRLRDLGRVLRGESPAESIRAPHNAVLVDEQAEHDVVIGPRSPKRR
jgi:hypothetical protein